MKAKIIWVLTLMFSTVSLFAQNEATGNTKINDTKAEQLLNNVELAYKKSDFNETIKILNEALKVGKEEFTTSKNKEEKYFAERLLADICTKLSDCYIHLGNKELARDWLVKSSFTYYNPWSLLRYAKAYKEDVISLSTIEEKNVSVKFGKKKDYVDARTACLFAVNYAQRNISLYGESEQMKKKLEEELKRVQSASEAQLNSKIQTKTVSY